MSTATVTSKGQITIPSAIRSALKVVAGDRVEFVRTADDRFEVVAATQEVTQMRGMIKAKRKVSIEEMNQAVRAKAGKR
jgi:AbrB family looped-hinge helix DNA binding protein